MPTFQYRARDRKGAETNGSIDASDRRQAAQRLQRDGLTPLVLKEAGSGAESATFTARLKSLLRRPENTTASSAGPAVIEERTGRGPSRERIGMQFLKQLLELHNSGLPLGDAIRVLSQRLTDPQMKGIAAKLWRELSEGATLAQALNRQPRYFADSIAYVIEAGEATGNLSPVLTKVVEYLEEKNAIRSKMVSSMIYPGVICLFVIGVMIFFLTVLLPMIQKMLDQLGGEMTWSARILIDGADLLITFGPFALVALIVGSIALKQWRKTESGRLATDTWTLRVPLIGKIYSSADLFQVTNLISTLLNSGINTTETLQLTERTIRNRKLRAGFHLSRNQVNEGLSIAQAFKRNDVMPPIALDILTVGENTGNLGSSMEQLARSFRDQLTKRLTLMITIVSTGALIFAFSMVALVAIGIVTSIFAVSNTL